MKQSFENFLLEKREIINKAIKRYPNYSQLVYTTEDYKRICEMVIYKIWKEDLYIEEENRNGYIYMACCSALSSKHRESFNTGKNKLYTDALRLDYTYSDENDSSKSNTWETLKSFEEKGYHELGMSDIWDIVRKVLYKEKHVELFISYYKSDCSNMSEYFRENKVDMSYHAMRRFFEKYTRILRENYKYFVDFV